MRKLMIIIMCAVFVIGICSAAFAAANRVETISSTRIESSIKQATSAVAEKESTAFTIKKESANVNIEQIKKVIPVNAQLHRPANSYLGQANRYREHGRPGVSDEESAPIEDTIDEVANPGRGK